MTTPNIPRLEAPTSSFPANSNQQNPGQRQIESKNKVSREYDNVDYLRRTMAMEGYSHFESVVSAQSN
jgi:hypothetical protein